MCQQKSIIELSSNQWISLFFPTRKDDCRNISCRFSLRCSHRSLALATVICALYLSNNGNHVYLHDHVNMRMIADFFCLFFSVFLCFSRKRSFSSLSYTLLLFVCFSGKYYVYLLCSIRLTMQIDGKDETRERDRHTRASFHHSLSL